MFKLLLKNKMKHKKSIFLCSAPKDSGIIFLTHFFFILVFITSHYIFWSNLVNNGLINYFFKVQSVFLPRITKQHPKIKN